MNDMLKEMWDQQAGFMRLLQEKRGFPAFPVDITSKSGQELIKKYSHECSDELTEARQHLKNSKSHRATEIKEIDREAYLEELVDSLHYFLEVCILSGIEPEELFKSYMDKGQVNVDRIVGGY